MSENNNKFSKLLADFGDAEQEKIEKLRKQYEAISNGVEKDDLYYVQTINKYIKFNKNRNDWMIFTPDSMAHMYPQFSGQKNKQLFLQAMEHRRFHDCVYTFDNQDPLSLNLLRKDGWLLPKQGDVHPVFDTLMDSLSGGKRVNATHIEHCIAWKYLHPSDVNLPCMVFYPEGGVGKNVLVDIVLKRVFGGQSASVKGESLLGQFNSSAKGMAVLYIDELTKDKASMEKLKHMVQQKFLDINEKHLPVKVIENTAMYIIGSNDTQGPITLANDGSDRRWSILNIPANKTLKYWIAKNYNVEQSEINIQQYIDILGDSEQVAKWLNHIVMKYKDKGCPAPLHGEDYHKLLDAQKTELVELCETVFLRKDFKFIKFIDLWNEYKTRLREDNPSGINYTKKSIFKTRVKDWIERNCPSVEWRGGDSKVKVMTDGKWTTVEGFFKKGGENFDTADSLDFEHDPKVRSVSI